MNTRKPLVIIFEGDDSRIEEELRGQIPTIEIIRATEIENVREYSVIALYGVSERDEGELSKMMKTASNDAQVIYCTEQIDFDFLGLLNDRFEVTGVCLSENFRDIASNISSLIADQEMSDNMKKFGGL